MNADNTFEMINESENPTDLRTFEEYMWSVKLAGGSSQRGVDGMTSSV